MKYARGLVALSLLLCRAPTISFADPVESVARSPDSNVGADSFGMRIGGYGFRNTHAQGLSDKWSDCRMNGVGVFAQHDFTANAFVEGGTDVYFGDNFILGNDASNQNMDRLSGLFTVATGLRMYPTSRISGYAQIGVGLELTRVTLTPRNRASPTGPTTMKPAGPGNVSDEQNRALPVGFIGFGGDIRVGPKTRLGANLRTYLMGHYDHGDDVTQLQLEPEAANQVQFYLRYTL